VFAKAKIFPFGLKVSLLIAIMQPLTCFCFADWPSKLKIKGGRHLEAFSLQLVVLAVWKQAIHICNACAASTGESPSRDIPMKGFSVDAPHLLATSQLADDVYMQIERQFLAQVEYAEELPCTVGQIPGM
jgi:serine/threonine-protein kinase ULK2